MVTSPSGNAEGLWFVPGTELCGASCAAPCASMGTVGATVSWGRAGVPARDAGSERLSTLARSTQLEPVLTLRLTLEPGFCRDVPPPLSLAPSAVQQGGGRCG